MTQVSVDSSRLNAKLGRIEAAIPGAARVALQDIARRFGGNIRIIARKDTNRYVRGWLQAAGDPRLGINVGALPTIKPSKYADRIRELIEDQSARLAERLAKINQFIARVYPNGRPKRPTTDTYDRLQRDKKRIEKDYESAQLQLRRLYAGEPLNEDGRSTLLIGFLHSGQAQRGRRLLTVRAPVYGGEGHFSMFGHLAVTTLRNKEPHAKILERKYGAFRKAFALSTNGAALLSGGRNFSAHIRQKAGL